MKTTDHIISDCRRIARNYSICSGIASVSPIPGSEVAIDAVIVTSMLKEILSRFHLNRSDIDMQSMAAQTQLMIIIKTTGCQIVGNAITTRMVIQLVAGMGIKAASKRAGRFIPFIGQVAGAVISYAAMKKIGEIAIDECIRVTSYQLQPKHGQTYENDC